MVLNSACALHRDNNLNVKKKTSQSCNIWDYIIATAHARLHTSTARTSPNIYNNQAKETIQHFYLAILVVHIRSVLSHSGDIHQTAAESLWFCGRQCTVFHCLLPRWQITVQTTHQIKALQMQVVLYSSLELVLMTFFAG